MIPQHIAIVWVKYKSLSSFDGVRSFFLSDEDFVGSVNSGSVSYTHLQFFLVIMHFHLCYLYLCYMFPGIYMNLFGAINVQSEVHLIGVENLLY